MRLYETRRLASALSFFCSSRTQHADLSGLVYLIHWPVALNPNGNHHAIPTLPNGHRDIVRDWELRETWKQMEAMVKKGKVRSIGVSNTSQRKLEEEILPYAEIPPAVDQVCSFLFAIPSLCWLIPIVRVPSA